MTYLISSISSIYKEPQLNVKDGKLKSSTKFQQTGVRQGCPLSPYLFIILLSTIMKDTDNNFTREEADIFNLSHPKPEYTMGGTVWGGAKRGGGAEQDRAGPDADGSVCPGHNRPSCPPEHRRQLS